MNAWWDRLLGVATERSFSKQEEEYAPHRAKMDYAWNTAGLASWGLVFPLFTIIVTQLVGVEQAGMFALAFVVGNLLLIVANYGVRAYQVSDIDEEQSFFDYQINRWITCAIMLLAGLVYCAVRGYEGEMFFMSIGIYLYKMIDGLADVYEGRLQQMDKLYLAGISQMVRSIAVVIVFTVLLFVTRDLGVASMSLAVIAAISFLLLTLPLAMLETPRSGRADFGGVVEIFKQCLPLFVALFLYNFIDNMPKFVMEGTLGYDNQIYFNALYFPAQAILLTAGFVYKPLLVRMANAWADPGKRRRFDILIVVIVAIIVVLTVLSMFFMGWIGIPIMSFLYGIDFSQFTDLSFVMLVAGGITGGIDFLYQVITVIRRQKVVMRLYLITFCCSLVLPLILVNVLGLQGAVYSYLTLMGVLFVLLAWEYVRARISFARHPEIDPVLALPPSGGSGVRGDGSR